MRIAIASVGQETCSFTPVRTTLATFRQYGLYEGDEILQRMRETGPIGGFLAAVQAEAIELVPLPIIRGWGSANGMLTAETLAFFEDKIVTGLQQALPLDGFFFDLHGAAAAENEPDVEGYLLAAARRVIGPTVPMVASLDHHANITQLMIDMLDGLVGHRTQPHDPFDTGKLAGHLLFSLVRKDVTPTMAWRKIPMLAHQEQFLTSRGPMKEWFDCARAMETDPAVLAVSLFPMQPWLDVPEGGWATVVVTNNDQPLAEKLAAELAQMLWDMRERFWVYESIPVEEAVRKAEKAGQGLIILSDTGDSVFGGASGDSTCILKELLRQQISSPTLMTMVDAEVVDLAIRAGIGSMITAPLGGKLASEFNQPVTVTAKVAAIGGGRIDVTIVGVESFDMGRAVVLDVGPIKIVVSEREGVGGNHPIVYRHFGIEPAQAKIAVLKTASNFQYYTDLTSEIIRVDSPGPTMSHLEKFAWQHVPRPIYPLDELASWQA
ncbi:MAG: M81 family metallopeptidase [Chloroflexi bacterium]|nr:M81 family metallopeptidase [Chloroflexota bacterium]